MKGNKTEGSRRVPPFVGEQGLSRLVSKARNEYTKEVLTGRKSYARFCKDMLASVAYHDAKDAWSRNEHNRNLCAITDMLTMHRQLVETYFSRETFSENDIVDMVDRFNKIETDHPKRNASPGVPASPETASAVECGSRTIKKLEDQVISLIVHCANEAELFYGNVTPQHFDAYYSGNPLTPLRSRKNTELVVLFSILENEELIERSWQHVIDRDGLVLFLQQRIAVQTGNVIHT